MGRRFGRQQKRQMRADIAEKANAIEHLTRQSHSLRQKVQEQRSEIWQLQGEIDAYRATIETARDVLGRHWIGLPALVEPIGRIPDFDRVQLHIMQMSAVMSRALYSPRQELATFKEEIDRIEAGIMRGRIDRHLYLNESHVRFQTPQGDVAYAFTEQAFKNVPLHKAVKLIAQEMARFMLTKFEPLRPDPAKMKDWA